MAPRPKCRGTAKAPLPCSPVTAKSVPTGDSWVHEVKFDGYHVQAHKVGSRVILFSRNGHDFRERFPSIVQELRELPARAAVLDGEVVASDIDGRPNFARLPCLGGPSLSQRWYRYSWGASPE